MRTPAPLVLASLCLLLLEGCGPRGLLPCTQRISGVDDVQPTVALTGATASIEILLPVVSSCGDTLVASRVSATVVDAENQEVAVRASPPSSNSASGFRTVVEFTPTTPGLFHITAQFEPSIGLAQRDVVVAQDKTALPVETVAGFTRKCRAVHASAGGAALCLVEASTPVLAVLRGGAHQADLVAGGVAVDATAVWTWSGQKVTRWTDSGAGALTQDAEVLLPTDVTLAAGVAAPQGLYLVTASRVLRVEKRTTGLTVALDTAVQLPLSALDEWHLAARTDNALAVAQGSKVCRLPVTPGLRETCFDVKDTIRAVDGEGFWADASDTPGGVRYIRLVGSPLAPTSAPFFTGSPELRAQPQAKGVPVVTWLGRPLVADPAALDFTAYAALSGAVTIERASTSMLALRSGAGELMLLRR